MLKKITIILFVLGLIYIIWPGPSSINDIAQLPDSLKSDEPGDNQSEIVAYFSNGRRKDVTNFYKNQMSYLNIFMFTIPPIRSNHPPEEAFTYIKDQQPSTYLEQYSLPFRDALYVNGFEPFNAQGKPYREGATRIFVKNNFYDSKTTLHYYGSSLSIRIVIYILSWICIILLFKLSRKALTEK